MRTTKSCRQCHSGTSAARRGSSFCYPCPQPVSNRLKKVDHPFVVNLRYAFQDDQNCFFALDLMLGGDLRCMYIPFRICPFPGLRSYSSVRTYLRLTVHLERKGVIEEAVVKFWVAELASAISYLHKQRIIHRCVPPDIGCAPHRHTQRKSDLVHCLP